MDIKQNNYNRTDLDPRGFERRGDNSFAQTSKPVANNPLSIANEQAKQQISAALNTAANSLAKPSFQETLFAKPSELKQADVDAMNVVRNNDGQYFIEEGQYQRSGNTFRITDGPLEGYKLIYKGGRNFQIRNAEDQSLMIYHGPCRRPRIAQYTKAGH